jgi:hypothetical protein
MSFSATHDTAPSVAEIRAHLAEIFASPQFRSSKRCQNLLTFLVQTAIEGRQHILKERVIGVEVFNRSADYNPASDPAVRVYVAEVRKRLAQYYQDAPPNARAPRIRVATGHYVPEFSWAEESHVEPPLVERPPRRLWLAWAALATAGVLLAAIWIWAHPSNSLDRFWGPALRGRHTPLLLTERYGPSSIMYRFNAEVAKSRTQVPASATLLASDIEATFGQTVMFGNIFALRSLDRLFSSRGLDPELRIGGEINMAELAERPVILIGYFNNPWAKNVDSEKPRFTLANERRGDLFVHAIHDSLHPAAQWSISSDRPWFENTVVSYAIVTRIYDRRSGRFLVSIAGMTHLATSAAAEFVTRQSSVDELQRQAPSGWEKMNVQAVLQTNIVNQTAAPPKLLASHFW